MTDSDDLQQELFSNPVLDSEYSRLWEPHGFSYQAFLRWRSADAVWVYPAPGPLLNPREIAQMNILDDNTGDKLNPHWASAWADFFPDPQTALRWSTLTHNPSHAFHMKRLGYREPRRAEILHNVLLHAGWLPVLENRSDLKFPIPNPDRVINSHTDREWVKLTSALYLSPTFRFSSGQARALSEHIDANLRSHDNLSEITKVLLLMKKRGWPLPDGDGLFSLILDFSVGIFQGPIIITAMAQAGDSYDDFITLLRLIKDILAPTRTDVARALYSLRTGVPMDWVDDDLGRDVEYSRIEEVRWAPVVPLRDQANSNPIKYLCDDMDAEAERLR